MNAISCLQRLQAAKRTVFTANDLRLLLGVRNDSSFHTALHRLVGRGVLQRLGKGLFIIAGSPVDPFALANHLRRPSYVSLESALNLHGLLIQSPRVITSVTTGRGCRLHSGGYEFVYRHLTARLWFGFEQNGTFLVASPEKAFLDWLYLASRSSRPALLNDIAWRRLNRRQLDEWAARVSSPLFQRAYSQWLGKPIRKAKIDAHS